MFKLIQGTTRDFADADTFLRSINELACNGGPAADLFGSEGEIVVARAPGRLDVMGGIADYSGSLVLQLPIAEATLAAVQQAADQKLVIVSLGGEGNERDSRFEMNLADFEQAGQPISYAEARQLFERDARTKWAAYAAGAFLVLRREKGVGFHQGARVLISSQVPEGKGVSSSAAIEVAVMSAVAAVWGIDLDPRELAVLCQKVENLVVGAPCGVMDQMTSACGHEGQLLTLLCQPAELQRPVQLPEEVAVWGLDSGIRHAVSGSDYGSVRVGAFMGYRIIAELAGLAATADGNRVHVEDAQWRGYLANVTPSQFEQYYADKIPARINGGEFHDRYRGTTDTITRVDPARDYAVLKPTAHPIYEHFRVRTFAELLAGPMSAHRMELLGELMYQSHASYSACGLGSEGTDLLVDLVRRAGVSKGLFGAKITGGGSGGTVAVLGWKGADAGVQSVTEEYARRTGHQPYVFKGSSPGASAFGCMKLGR